MTNITLDQDVTPTAETEPSNTETNAKKATKSAKPAKKAVSGL